MHILKVVLPVGAPAECSGRPERGRLPVVVGVREAVEVAAVPFQLGHAAVMLLRPPLPEIINTIIMGFVVHH